MALMKHRGLFELLEKHGSMLLDMKFQGDNSVYGRGSLKAASQATRIAITTMLEELAPNLWEDDLNRLVDFGHLISPALEMVIDASLQTFIFLLMKAEQHFIKCEFFGGFFATTLHSFLSFPHRKFSRLCCTARQ